MSEGDNTLNILNFLVMKTLKSKYFFLIIFMILSGIVKAQEDEEDIFYEPLKLAGPRVGITYVSGDLGKMMVENGISPYLSQFGWQFETRYFTTRTGFQGLIETVILVGGLETDNPTLSGSLLVGFRTAAGFEAGAGPSISTSGGHSFVMAIGHTAKTEYVNIPINFAIDPSSSAVKYSLLVGFNIRKR